MSSKRRFEELLNSGGNFCLETIFIAAFPGLFLYTLDCKKVLQAWMIGHKKKYDIEITQESADWCKFRFSFTEPFVKIAYEGFGEKGEQEFQRAKEMEFLFKQKYECTLFSVGYLTAPVNIPEDSSDIIKQMSRTEAKFQLYHVSKALYESITEVEQMNNAEFTLFYTYVGEDGLEGISRKFAKDIKKNLEEDIHNTRTLIHQEQRDIGGFRWFPLGILSP